MSRCLRVKNNNQRSPITNQGCCVVHRGVGRGTGDGRDRGVGLSLGVGVALGVAVDVAVADGVAVAVAVGVGEGVGAGTAQYLPPVFKLMKLFLPPQTIISLPVHTAV